MNGTAALLSSPEAFTISIGKNAIVSFVLGYFGHENQLLKLLTLGSNEIL